MALVEGGKLLFQGTRIRGGYHGFGCWVDCDGEKSESVIHLGEVGLLESVLVSVCSSSQSILSRDLDIGFS